MKEIHAEELKNILDSTEDFMLFDVRGDEAYDSEHIPGAISAPPDNMLEIVRLHASMEDRIVVYCGSTKCAASEEAARNLEKSGFSNVHRFVEGIEGWKKAGFEVVSMAVV